MMDDKMKAALLAWCHEEDIGVAGFHSMVCDVAEWTLDYLRSQQEPVQWQKRHPVRTGSIWEDTNEHDAKWWRDNAKGWEIRVLYAHPIPAPAVPDGWRLVPIEPTPEMLAAADAADREYTDRCFGTGSALIQQGAYDHWCAMLAATPSPKENK